MRNPPMPPRAGGSPWALPPRPLVLWRETLASDPTEHELLFAIRATPGDEGARMVYADWLEQRGRADEASFVRKAGNLPPLAGVPEWRRITSRATISLCERVQCPGRWDLLLSDRISEELRGCPRCMNTGGHFVRYIATTDDAMYAGYHSGGGPVAIDAAADADDLVSTYRLWQVRSGSKGSGRVPG